MQPQFATALLRDPIYAILDELYAHPDQFYTEPLQQFFKVGIHATNWGCPLHSKGEVVHYLTDFFHVLRGVFHLRTRPTDNSHALLSILEDYLTSVINSIRTIESIKNLSPAVLDVERYFVSYRTPALKYVAVLRWLTFGPTWLTHPLRLDMRMRPEFYFDTVEHGTAYPVIAKLDAMILICPFNGTDESDPPSE